MANKYVPIFFDWKETTVDLTQEQKGNLIDAVVDYASVERSESDILSDLDGMERVAFRFLKGQVNRYLELSETRSRSASRSKQTEANLSKPQQTPTNSQNKNNNNNNNKNNNNNSIAAKATERKFQKPTVEEVRTYIVERNNGLTAQDAETFVDFYEAKGWKIGNQPMKDWKAAVRTWENKRKGGNNGGGYTGRGSIPASEVRSDYSFLKT